MRILKKLVIGSLLVSFSISSICAQNTTINGRIITDDLETVPRVWIMINDTIEVGKSELNGSFQIDIPNYEKKIQFKYDGLIPATIALTDNRNKIELVIMYTYTYDFITLRRAERMRKKGMISLTRYTN